ncbi:uncharacterized protein CIMG_13178 [Coccidioides immitis RS]|uniref:Uncharacterized protein n=2 Tax=Coccidioides immitis TaxID=5501 RepID=A0A0D8JTS1_COCIM|nr:uncharacterized protein CIMG_13178 [Coccidioides immitis RS]KJF60735.1 hypothetical protein CIMG_13178 [Coccidioides immitis RS]
MNDNCFEILRLNSFDVMRGLCKPTNNHVPQISAEIGPVACLASTLRIIPDIFRLPHNWKVPAAQALGAVGSPPVLWWWSLFSSPRSSPHDCVGGDLFPHGAVATASCYYPDARWLQENLKFVRGGVRYTMFRSMFFQLLRMGVQRQASGLSSHLASDT